jgi:hypothetical protein
MKRDDADGVQSEAEATVTEGDDAHRPKPPAEGTVQTQGDSVVVISVALAATPFLQAVATHFGTRLAGVIDETTRAAVQRFLRRTATGPGPREESRASIRLTTDNGWSVVLGVDTPAEAIAQLQQIHDGPVPELAESPAPRLVWREGAWWLQAVREGALVEQTWDAERAIWS